MPKLPAPITVTDEYLAAIHDVLGDIRDRLPAPKAKPAAAGTHKVSEPAAKPAAKKAAARKS